MLGGLVPVEDRGRRDRAWPGSRRGTAAGSRSASWPRSAAGIVVGELPAPRWSRTPAEPRARRIALVEDRGWDRARRVRARRSARGPGSRSARSCWSRTTPGSVPGELPARSAGSRLAAWSWLKTGVRVHARQVRSRRDRGRRAARPGAGRGWRPGSHSAELALGELPARSAGSRCSGATAGAGIVVGELPDLVAVQAGAEHGPDTGRERRRPRGQLAKARTRPRSSTSTKAPSGEATPPRRATLRTRVILAARNSRVGKCRVGK